MELKEYFEKKSGIGVLSTADKEGMVDAAIYSKPYVIDDSTVVFIMADRLTRKNLNSSPGAAFLFIEAGNGFTGKRLLMKMAKEGTGEGESDRELLEWYQTTKKVYPRETLYLAYFDVQRVLPLVSELEQTG